jgi:hypothetical protein
VELTILDFVVFTLAAFRLTRIITTDNVADNFRQWVWSKYDPSTKIGYLITCNWCTGFWVSLLFVAGASVLPQLTFVVSLVLAISALVGLLSAWAER